MLVHFLAFPQPQCNLPAELSGRLPWTGFAAALEFRKRALTTTRESHVKHACTCEVKAHSQMCRYGDGETLQADVQQAY